MRFKLKLESFKDNDWIFVGTVKANVKPKDNDSHKCIDDKKCVLGKNRDQGLLGN